MSLINEALKRAKEAQEHAPAAALSAAHFRPVEPTHTAQQTAGLLLPIVLTVVALGGLFFLWQASQVNGGGDAVNPAPRRAVFPPVRPAGQPLAPIAVAPTAPTPAPSVARGPSPAAGASPQSSAVSSPVTSAAVAATLVAPAPLPASATTPSASPNVSAVAQITPPKPAPLRLQAIVFNPSHPSAMVNGKTLFVGDRVGPLQVSAITRDSATLVGPGGTNLLSLEP